MASLNWIRLPGGIIPEGYRDASPQAHREGLCPSDEAGRTRPDRYLWPCRADGFLKRAEVGKSGGLEFDGFAFKDEVVGPDRSSLRLSMPPAWTYPVMSGSHRKILSNLALPSATSLNTRFQETEKVISTADMRRKPVVPEPALSHAVAADRRIHRQGAVRDPRA